MSRKIFFAKTRDSCCSICNPVSLVDYEETCIRATLPDGQTIYICLKCVGHLDRALRPGEETFSVDMETEIAALITGRRIFVMPGKK